MLDFVLVLSSLTIIPKQTPTSPIESSAPEVATTKLPKENPYAESLIDECEISGDSESF